MVFFFVTSENNIDLEQTIQRYLASDESKTSFYSFLTHLHPSQTEFLGKYSLRL